MTRKLCFVSASIEGRPRTLSIVFHRLNELRKLGVNAIRTAHNPPAPDFLDLTDRMGFIVMDELFDQWTVAKNPFDYHLDFNKWSKIDLRDTVRRDRNHPSVILYSAGKLVHFWKVFPSHLFTSQEDKTRVLRARRNSLFWLGPKPISLCHLGRNIRRTTEL